MPQKGMVFVVHNPIAYVLLQKTQKKRGSNLNVNPGIQTAGLCLRI